MYLLENKITKLLAKEGDRLNTEEHSIKSTGKFIDITQDDDTEFTPD